MKKVMVEKTVWIDEVRRILAFHPFENSRKIIKTEGVFWNYISGLMQAGYLVM